MDWFGNPEKSKARTTVTSQLDRDHGQSFLLCSHLSLNELRTIPTIVIAHLNILGFPIGSAY